VKLGDVSFEGCVVSQKSADAPLDA
jgi:hypothetical protein